jgi:hypothetical protein
MGLHQASADEGDLSTNLSPFVLFQSKINCLIIRDMALFSTNNFLMETF